MMTWIVNKNDGCGTENGTIMGNMTFYKKTLRVPNCWGRVPFLLLKNNRNSTTDLEHIKGLIDAYDLISSKGTNNFLDLVELYWVIYGYGGDEASTIMKSYR